MGWSLLRVIINICWRRTTTDWMSSLSRWSWWMMSFAGNPDCSAGLWRNLANKMITKRHLNMKLRHCFYNKQQIYQVCRCAPKLCMATQCYRTLYSISTAQSTYPRTQKKPQSKGITICTRQSTGCQGMSVACWVCWGFPAVIPTYVPAGWSSGSAFVHH